MPKSKHNWDKLKLEFFQSDFSEVKPFLIQKGVLRKGQKYGSNTAVKTKGWGKEKRTLFENAFKVVKKDMTNEIKPYIKEYLISFIEAKILCINGLIERMGHDMNFNNPNRLSMKVTDLRSILEIIKTELGEPIKIADKGQVKPDIDLNKLIERIEKSDEPFDPLKNEKELYGEPTDLPEIYIDGVKQ